MCTELRYGRNAHSSSRQVSIPTIAGALHKIGARRTLAVNHISLFDEGCGQVRVLIVDDDPPIRDVLSSLLSEEGYDVAEAENGLLALELIRSDDEPVVVVLDLFMPLLGGEEVIRRVSADAAMRLRCAFVLVTANSESMSPAMKRLVAEQHIPFIRKPFDLDALLTTITSAACSFAANTSPHRAQSSHPAH